MIWNREQGTYKKNNNKRSIFHLVSNDKYILRTLKYIEMILMNGVFNENLRRNEKHPESGIMTKVLTSGVLVHLNRGSGVGKIRGRVRVEERGAVRSE